MRGEGDGDDPKKGKARRARVWVAGIARFETSRGVAWKIRYRVPLGPGSTATKQVTETLRYCSDRKQATGVLARRQTEIFEGTYRPRNAQKPVTVAEMVETTIEARSGEFRDGARIAAVLRNHIARVLGKKYLFEVTTSTSEDYRRARIAEGVEPATVRKELRYMQIVFVEARKRGIVTHDPVADVSFKGIKNARKRTPTDAELTRLIASALQAQPTLRAIFFALACSGMRIASVLSLRWSRLNFDERWIDVVQKGGEEIRIPMSPLLCAELSLWRPFSETLGRGSDLVFPGLRRDKIGPHPSLSQSWVHTHWPELLDAARVEGLTRHDMRRWMVTALRSIARGDDKAIGGVSGHSGAPMIDRYDQGALDRASALVAQTDLKLISAGATLADTKAPSATEQSTDSDKKVP